MNLLRKQLRQQYEHVLSPGEETIVTKNGHGTFLVRCPEQGNPERLDASMIGREIGVQFHRLGHERVNERLHVDPQDLADEIARLVLEGRRRNKPRIQVTSLSEYVPDGARYSGPTVPPPDPKEFSQIEEAIARAETANKSIDELRKRRKDAEAVRGELDDRLCKVCWDASANVLIMPCKHNALCETCEVQVKECPICRGPKTKVMTIFSYSHSYLLTSKLTWHIKAVCGPCASSWT